MASAKRPSAPSNGSSSKKTRTAAPLKGQTTLSSKGTVTAAGIHTDVVLQTVVDPKPPLISHTGYYVVQSVSGTVYRGVFPDLCVPGAIFGFHLDLEVRAEGASFYVVKVKAIRQRPLTYSLLERIYQVHIQLKERRVIDASQSDRRLSQLFRQLNAKDFVRPYIRESVDAPQLPLDQLLERVNACKYTPDQLNNLNILRPLLLDARILDNAGELTDLHANSDYFSLGRGHDHVLFRAYGGGYQRLYPPCVLDPMRALMIDTPHLCFYASTVPPLIPRLHFEKTPLKMPPAERALVQTYTLFMDMFQERKYSGSDALPEGCVDLSSECLAELLRREILVKSHAPAWSNPARNEEYLHDGYSWRAQQWLIELFVGLMQRDCRWPMVGDRCFDIYQEQASTALSLCSLLLVIGGPGRGKTMWLVYVLTELAQRGKQILLMVPTGEVQDLLVDALVKRADELGGEQWVADYVAEVPFPKSDVRAPDGKGRIVVRTFQSVYYDCVTEGDYRGIRSFDMVSMDEASMLGLVNGYDVLQLFDWKFVERLLLTFDAYQLGPVDDAAMAAQMVGIVPTVELKKMWRSTSEVVLRNLEKLKHGNIDFEYDDSWMHIDGDYKTVVEVHKRLEMTPATTLVTTYYKDDVKALRKELFAYHFPLFAQQPGADEALYPGELVMSMAKIKAAKLVRKSKRVIEHVEKCVGIKDLVTKETHTNVSQTQIAKALASKRHMLFWEKVPRLELETWHLCRLQLSRDTMVQLLDVPTTALVRGYADTVHGSQGGQAPDSVFYVTRLPNYVNQMLEPAAVYVALSRARNRQVIVGSMTVLQEQLECARREKRVFSTFKYHLKTSWQRSQATGPGRIPIPPSRTTRATPDEEEESLLQHPSFAEARVEPPAAVAVVPAVIDSC